MKPSGDRFEQVMALARKAEGARVGVKSEAVIRRILTKWAAEIQGVAPMSEERKEAFFKYSPQIRRELKPEQHQAYDAMVESMKIRAIRKQKKRSGP